MIKFFRGRKKTPEDPQISREHFREQTVLHMDTEVSFRCALLEGQGDKKANAILESSLSNLTAIKLWGDSVTHRWIKCMRVLLSENTVGDKIEKTKCNSRLPSCTGKFPLTRRSMKQYSER